MSLHDHNNGSESYPSYSVWGRYSVTFCFFNIVLISFDGDVVDEFQQSLATHIVVPTDKEVVDVDFC